MLLVIKRPLLTPLGLGSSQSAGRAARARAEADTKKVGSAQQTRRVSSPNKRLLV